MTLNGSFRSPNILLVDDEHFIRRVTVQVLNNLNIPHVIEAEDGVDAIAILRQKEVDLLITDIQMPNMNGLELIKQIRMGNTSADRELRILVVTSFSNMEVLSSCIALDVNGFLVKPIKSESAMQKIQLALNEAMYLNDSEAYSSVKTDLESLAEAVEKEKKIRASILKEEIEKEGILVSLGELKPGMKLLEDLYVKNGSKLLSKGNILNESLINRIQELQSVIPASELRVKFATQ